MNNGEWQKPFVDKITKQLGIYYELAMTIMAWTAEERINAYMEGYNKGWTDGRGKNENQK